MIRYLFYLKFVLFIGVFYSCHVKTLNINTLLCEHSIDPIGVDNLYPLLSWKLTSTVGCKKQVAYRIIVSSDSVLLEQNKGNIWDTGKVFSSDTQVRYHGLELVSRQCLYWKVLVWDENDVASEWSDVAKWTMGLLNSSDWKACWIGDRIDTFPDSTLTTPAPYFRKSFSTNKAIKKAMAYVCGLGFYEMYINGTKVGNQVLAPAVTNYDIRSLKHLLYHYDDQSTQRVFYNVFEVTDLLRKDNVIGVILGNGWYNQRDRTVEGYMWYDVPKMILQIEVEYNDGSIETVISDESWKTKTGPLLHDAIFTGEIYDARKDLGDWCDFLYDASDWNSALLVRAPIGMLRSQNVPYNRVMDVVATNFKQIDDSTYLFSLPETISGWCMLNGIKGNSGDRLRLRFISEEMLDYGQEDVYFCNGEGQENWEPKFTWHTFRKVEITTKNIKLSKNNLIVKKIYTDINRTGYFKCSNELLNKLVEAYNRTMQANFKGIISSDPHRERLAYTGDGQVISESLLYSYDMTCLLRKFIDDMEDARNKKTGYVPHTAPFGGGGGGPAWGSAYIIIPWNYYCHYGDITILKEHYEGMKHWIHYLGTRTDERGLIVREEPRGWCLGEWCTLNNQNDIPEELVNTAFYYHIVCIMSKISDVLDKNEDHRYFVALAQTIKNDFNREFFDPLSHHYWEGRQGSDVFALGFDLVPDTNKEDVFKALLRHLENIDFHFDTGIFGTPLLLKVLTDNGRADIAYKLMDQRDYPGFGYLLEEQNSTLWETWDGGGGLGHCHPMFGSVVAWLYSSLAGIKPDETQPGMKHFYVAPTPVLDLEYCKASYNTLYGEIVSEWSVDEIGNLTLRIEVPVNTSATVIFPQWGKSIKKKPRIISSGLHIFTINMDS